MHFDHEKESGLSATIIFKTTMMMIQLQLKLYLKPSTTSTQTLPQVQHNFNSSSTSSLAQLQVKIYLKSKTTNNPGRSKPTLPTPFFSFPRKNADFLKRSHTRLYCLARQCTAAVFHPTWRTSLVHHKKGRPRAATSHESRSGKPSFWTSVVRTRPLVLGRNR